MLSRWKHGGFGKHYVKCDIFSMRLYAHGGRNTSWEFRSFKLKGVFRQDAFNVERCAFSGWLVKSSGNPWSLVYNQCQSSKLIPHPARDRWQRDFHVFLWLPNEHEVSNPTSCRLIMTVWLVASFWRGLDAELVRRPETNPCRP